MEIIFGILGIWLVIFILTKVLGAFFSGLKAVGKTAFGEGSLSDNLDLEFKGMQQFEIQILTKVADNDLDLLRYEIQGKGLFPNQYKTELNFVTKVYDDTNNGLMPIISTVEEFQSEETPFFEFERTGPDVDVGYGFVNWNTVGIVVHDILVAPKSGQRSIQFIFSIFDKSGNLLKEYSKNKTLYIINKGYEESVKEREEVYTLNVKLAVYMGFSDDDFDKTEAQVIKNYLIKKINRYEDEKRNEIKDLLNNTYKESYRLAKQGKLSISKITKRLNEIADDPMKYETIELCLDVMAADGIADAGELEAVRKISNSLDLDFDEVQKLKDSRIKDLKMQATKDTDLKELIGIQPDWNNEQVNKHLRTEFKKWNNRFTSSKNESERESAKEKLNIIAQLRKEYE